MCIDGHVSAVRRRGHLWSTHHVLLAEPIELLELLGHEQLGTPHGTPDLAESCERQTGAGRVSQAQARACRRTLPLTGTEPCGRLLPSAGGNGRRPRASCGASAPGHQGNEFSRGPLWAPCCGRDRSSADAEVTGRRAWGRTHCTHGLGHLGSRRCQSLGFGESTLMPVTRWPQPSSWPVGMVSGSALRCT